MRLESNLIKPLEITASFPTFVPRPEHLPSHVCIQHSGGKDSTTLLIKVVKEYKGQCPITVFHQDLPEAWAGTAEYCQETCDRLGVPLVIQPIYYHGYQCRLCDNRYLSAKPKLRCPKCKQDAAGQQIAEIRGLVDLMDWRGMWPGQGAVRWCTAYLKRQVFNAWASAHRSELGPFPLNCMGERWAESSGRSHLPYLEPRNNLSWMTEWRPILHLRRIEVFGTIRAAGMQPHEAYALQGMTDQQMYEEDEEGGPRCSCVMCIFNTPAQLAHNLALPQNQALGDRLEEIEARTGHYFRQGLSIQQIRAGQFVVPKIVRTSGGECKRNVPKNLNLNKTPQAQHGQSNSHQLSWDF